MKKLILAVLISSAVAAPAFAQQLAPTPRAAPRTPVNRETVMERRAASHDVAGQALILDGERLRIDDTELRLFGVVPPQLSASFGPQARAALDGLIGGGQSISCHIRDRDHDGRLLANCRAANGADPALELLRRGLAVAARGSLADTDLAAPYVAAEQAAQNDKIGLWSVTLAAPSINAVAVAQPAAPKVETPKAEVPKVEVVAPKTSEVQAKTSSAIMVPVKQAVAEVAKDETRSTTDNSTWFARYQILIAGFLMLATALSILAALAISRRREKREEMQALAAALRGELMAARAVCQTRAKSIMTAEDDRTATWPRIRTTLYQAYVGKIGWLGAELARQVASIYGQASDYASYYGNAADAGMNATSSTPKRQALLALAGHIDDVLPRLAGIEQTGQRLVMQVPLAPVPVMQQFEPQTAVPAITSMVTEASAPAEAVKENSLRNVVRNIRERFETRPAVRDNEDHLGDYTAQIEEDAERFSFNSEDDDAISLGKMGRP